MASVKFPQTKTWVHCLAVVATLLVAGLIFLGRLLATWHAQPPVAAIGDLDGRPWRSTANEVKLRLATWNVWGIPASTPKRAARIRALAETVGRSGADIVCFQEVFLESDRETLSRILAAAGLPHSQYFASPPGGSGLLTVSRYPIREAAFHRFTEGGNPLAVQHGDWWAGKGAGVVTIDVPDFGTIRVVNTHLHARYRGDHYRSLRQGQLRELASVVDDAARPGAPTFLLGDLNHGKDDGVWVEFLENHPWQELSKAWSPIDYVIARKSRRFTFHHTPGKRLTGILSDDHTPLSDHAGILADVQIDYVGSLQNAAIAGLSSFPRGETLGLLR